MPLSYLYIDYVKTILNMKTFLPNQENSENKSNAMPEVNVVASNQIDRATKTKLSYCTD